MSKCGKQVGRKGAKDEITSMKLFFLTILLLYLFLLILSLHCLGFFFGCDARALHGCDFSCGGTEALGHLSFRG